MVPEDPELLTWGFETTLSCSARLQFLLPDPCSAFGSKSNFVFPSLNPAERGSPRRNLQDQDGASILKQGREPQDTQLRVPPPAGTPDPAELAAGTPCVSSSTPGRHSTQTPTDV